MGGLRSRPADPSPARRIGLLAGVVLLLFILAVGVAYARPVPALVATPVPVPSAVPGKPLAAQLPWPAQGSAAVAVAGLGTVGIANDTTPLPLASVTKIMTALVILESHPLAPGAQGPTITVTYDDVVEYLRFAGEDQSVVAIEEGERLTQRQLLEGLLVPSGNNFASLLARWDAGSVDAFVQKMNARAAALGMTRTHYADTSGISPESTSTAEDQLILAQAAMRNPVFAEIVGQPSTSLPVAGTRETTNILLGADGVVGVKTGHTDEAGGCFIIAMEREVAGERIQVIGVVLGQPSLDDAFAVSSRWDPLESTCRHASLSIL